MGGEAGDPMALETHLVAINWAAGQYQVAADFNGDIDLAALSADGYLHDVSDPAGGYLDRAAVVAKQHFSKYIKNTETATWWSSLPASVFFILIHQAEWESGFE
jgi:hypothetical protein